MLGKPASTVAITVRRLEEIKVPGPVGHSVLSQFREQSQLDRAAGEARPRAAGLRPSEHGWWDLRPRRVSAG